MLQAESDIKVIAGGLDISRLTNKPGQPELSRSLALVARHQDEDAFYHLFTFFAPKIKRYGLKQLRDEGQANDLVQETMTQVWKKAHLYDEHKGAATTWIYTVMRNACFDQMRRLKSRSEQNLGDDLWPLEQLSAEAPADNQYLGDHLMSKQLQRVVNNLPQTQRVVVQGVYYQELSQEQLSEQLQVPIGTIKSRLRLALAKIRQQMGDEEHD